MRDALERAYGVDGQRLLPWAALNAPFEGAWCVIRARSASEPHAHREYELFIAMRGSATLEVDGVRTPFANGDIARLAPGCTHRVINDGDSDFEMYSLWWDQEMSERFVARHGSGC
jgi:mannose-6-phosphate isomerase-like protein (cupin superfamily)